MSKKVIGYDKTKENIIYFLNLSIKWLRPKIYLRGASVTNEAANIQYKIQYFSPIM